MSDKFIMNNKICEICGELLTQYQVDFADGIKDVCVHCYYEQIINRKDAAVTYMIDSYEEVVDGYKRSISLLDNVIEAKDLQLNKLWRQLVFPDKKIKLSKSQEVAINNALPIEMRNQIDQLINYGKRKQRSLRRSTHKNRGKSEDSKIKG